MIKTISPLKSWEFLKFWTKMWPEVEDRLSLVKQGFPAKSNWFKALELTPYENVKVVILGQDPYHTKGMAMGLAFSVFPHVSPLPPSLRNILREYEDDLGYPTPKSGDLSHWAEEGCLLLNTILTVEEGRPLSHAGLGWEKLSFEIVNELSKRKEGLVFMLWGKHAQQYQGAIDHERHLVITSSHPSPFSAHAGFLGSKPFSRCNKYLVSIGKKPLDFKLR